jgi:hypothetical protein
MGFVEEVTLEPRYKGTIRCQNCGGEYSKNTEWCKVWDISKGTEKSKHVLARKLEKGFCPCCGTKEVSNDS